jgi:hypothetical protein
VELLHFSLYLFKSKPEASEINSHSNFLFEVSSGFSNERAARNNLFAPLDAVPCALRWPRKRHLCWENRRSLAACDLRLWLGKVIWPVRYFI